MNQPLAAIIHPEGNLNDNPNLTGIVLLLIERGWRVAVYSPRRREFPQKPPGDGSELVLVDRPDRHGCFLYSPSGVLDPQVAASIAGASLVIGVDRGIIEASRIACGMRAPYGLISYEITFESETSRAFKAPEIEACRGVDFAIVQDEVRGRELSRENQIPPARFFYVPVAGAEVYPPPPDRPRLFHRRLGLAADARVALYMGSVAAWAQCDALLASVPRWPAGWHLVIHNRRGIDAETREILRAAPRAPERIHVSAEPFGSPAAMHDFIHSADLGIAFYRATYSHYNLGRNILHIGMASGKTATYLQHGLPVAVTPTGEMSDHVRRRRLGMVVEDPARFVPDDAVLDSGGRCLDFFRERLDLRRTLRRWLDHVDRAARSLAPAVGEAGGPGFNRGCLQEEETRDRERLPLSRGNSGRIEEPASEGAGFVGWPGKASGASPAFAPGGHPDGSYRVSALVSCYNSAGFLRGCLDDLIGQTLYRRNELEIIVIDSGSTQDEHMIVAGYQRRHPHIRLLRTGRETLYAAWNRGIAVSRGRFITNANTDDAHRPDALELLARALERHPEADLAYGHSVFTRRPNDVYPGTACYFECRLPPFTPALGMLYCLLGPHPLWRRRVFSRIGLFDPAFLNAGDYDFQMRFIEAGLRAVVVPEILSLFFQNPNGLSLSSRQTQLESRRIEARYRALIPIRQLYEIDPADAGAAATAWVAQGNLALTWECAWQKHPSKEFDYAYQCFVKALELMPGLAPAVRNIAACLAAQGKWAEFGRWASLNPQVKDLESSAAERKPPPLVSVAGVRARSSPIYRDAPIRRA